MGFVYFSDSAQSRAYITAGEHTITPLEGYPIKPNKYLRRSQEFAVANI